MKSSYYSGLLVVFSWVIKMKNYMSKISDYCKKHWICIVLLALVIGIIIFYRRVQFWNWLTINTGSVADWIGNISIPVVLAWASHQHAVQKERQRNEEKATTVLKTLLDLLDLKNSELPQDLNQTDYGEKFQKVLSNNLSLLNEARNMIYIYRGVDKSEPIYQELRQVISAAKNNNSIGWDQAEDIQKVLTHAADALVNEYNRLTDNE